MSQLSALNNLPYFSQTLEGEDLKEQNLFCPAYLQVDLLVPTKVTGIITQGAKDFGHVQFVGSYKLAYSNDGEHWTVYQDEKQRKDKHFEHLFIISTGFSICETLENERAQGNIND
ncbi:hypothetical protein P7K49_004965 [Saguinus oedipus]|uniref:F5/8 type C domain-containing protein n=1 Tax=Saguinus oedipus TaxID=9490 RepID=A0ABQ9W8X9_SAGOE|nr:hypothetical protein P7K49_004965 [Saguinus oedipus]